MPLKLQTSGDMAFATPCRLTLGRYPTRPTQRSLAFLQRRWIPMRDLRSL